MSRLLDEIVQATVTSLAKQENELITIALAARLGVEKPNPYNYLNRMSRLDLADGYVVHLDGDPIIWIGKPVYHETFGDTKTNITTTLKIQYRLIDPKE